MKTQRLMSLFALLVISATGFAQTSHQDTLQLLMRKVDILSRELEKQRLGNVAERNYQSKFGMGPAASQVYFRKESGATIAGYGEMVYENYATETDNGTASAQKDKIDFLRQILYVGYKFNEQFVFNTEIEFEHGFVKGDDDAPGEVAVEFAYIDAMLSPAATIRAGMVLIPVGIVNEWHEPPTFFGALRPQTERNIIPSTWRGNGIGLLGSTDSGIGYRFFIVEGLNAAKFSASGIRSGRQSGGKAIAENFALTGRIEYTAISGLNVGASFFTGKSGQSLTTNSGEKIDAVTNVFSAHALFNRSGLELRALYAQSNIDDTELLNQTLGLNGNNAIGKKQSGFYITGAYNILKQINPSSSAQVLPFIQYEKLNTQKEVAAGYSANPKNEITNFTIGVMYRPITNIAFKLDFLNNKNEAGSGLDQLNFAVTYLF